jgi:hypothetical protein
MVQASAMASALRSFAVFTFASALALLTVPACSQQSEGERCDRLAEGNADCDSGLSCVAARELLVKTTDRCCPAAGTESDARCRRGSASGSGGSSTGGSSGSGGSGATSGAATDVGGADDGAAAGNGGVSAGVGGEPAGGGGGEDAAAAAGAAGQAGSAGSSE